MAVVHDPNGVAVELIDLGGGRDDGALPVTGLPSCAAGPGHARDDREELGHDTHES